MLIEIRCYIKNTGFHNLSKIFLFHELKLYNIKGGTNKQNIYYMLPISSGGLRMIIRKNPPNAVCWFSGVGDVEV